MSATRYSRPLGCLLSIVLSSAVFAQMTITGSISGTVVDPSGSAVPDAKITLTSQTTKEIREAATNESGAFNLVPVQPDTYSIKVEHAGLKTYELTGIVVSANERLS